MKTKLVTLLIVTSLFFSSQSFALIVYDPAVYLGVIKQYTQAVASYSKEVAQLTQQIAIVRNQVINLKQLGKIPDHKMEPVLNHLNEILASNHSLAYSTKNLDQTFNTLFPGVKDKNKTKLVDSEKNYNDNIHSRLNTSKEALDQLQALSSQQTATNNQINEVMHKKVNGNTQGLQQIAAMLRVMSSQLMTLQTTMANQANSSAAINAEKSQQEANKHAVKAKIFQYSKDVPDYDNSKGVGLFPKFQ